MRFKVFISITVFTLCGLLLRGQNNPYKFSHLDVTDGLSSNIVKSIYQDDKGFMWFGTNSGLTRYDGYQFKVFKHNDRDTNSLRENYVGHIYEGPDQTLWLSTNGGFSVYSLTGEKFSNNTGQQLARYNVYGFPLTLIKKDVGGKYWFVTKNKGVYCYNPQKKQTIYYTASLSSAAALHSNNIMDVVCNRQNQVWFIYYDGFIEQLNTTTNKITARVDGLAKLTGYKPEYYSMIIDNKDNLWIYSDSAPIGVYRCDNTTNTLLHFDRESLQYHINSAIINTIVQADDGKIWIGTDHGGINVIDPVTYKVTYLMNKEDDPNSLGGNCVMLYKDNSGIIWSGTFKQGISYYYNGIKQFPLFKHYVTDNQSLPYEDINAFVEDEKRNIWIGTNGGGLVYFNRLAHSYTQYKHDASRPESISNDIVVGLHIDINHKLWVGTYFGGVDCFDGHVFKHHRHNEKVPGTITDDRVYSIIEDSAGRLLAGGFAGGLNIYDPATDGFQHPAYPLVSGYISVLLEDKNKNIWIGSDEGVSLIFKKTNKVQRFVYKANNPNSIAGNNINAIIEDKHGLIWIGTGDGISIYDPEKDKFLNFKEQLNLANTNVTNLLEDNLGNMWVSSNSGIKRIRFNKKGDKYTFQTYDFNEFDGLQGREFNPNSAIKLKSGEMIFGGNHGFNLFDPAKINDLKPKQNLVFTDFQLFSKSVAVGDAVNGKVLLTQAIADVKSITLRHSDNVFSIEFSACNYFNPGKVKYQYKLEGFSNEWISPLGNDRKATYTNLVAGDYTFKVKAQNPKNAGNDSEIALKITVLPPLWKSMPAYISYVLMGAVLLLRIRRQGINKLKQQFELKQAKMEAERKVAHERAEARRMHQLDLMKIKFFTNVSHEFRTPLSLILSPIEDLVKMTDKPEMLNHLQMIKRNGKRLLGLVNQLLDFRKMENNELKLILNSGDIVQFIREVSASFTDVAHQKQIKYIFESDICALVSNFDHDKIERILFNLLSNAFKFTPANGCISVILSIPGADHKVLELKVIDTGIGIARENQERIFERFFQDDMPDDLLNQGSGIGLSITREFVKMQGGAISVESDPGYGSCFTVSIPLGKQNEPAVAAEAPTENAVTALAKTRDIVVDAAKKPAILLVEDNDDLRFYLKENLKQVFYIIEAVNGKDGWQKALALHPKLIVSDISMPVMNGLDLCRKIKEDNRTDQIPVLLLTALTGEENELAGLECGANDYIMKPFNFEILLSKIHNLLKMQQTMKNTYQKQIEIQSRDVMVESEDEKFLKRAFEYIEVNITNHNFSVEELARHLNMSRVSLYKKLLTLTGKTPVDYIRTIRLKKAIQLLEKSKLSIANVAYEVGFNNAAYFAKTFREEFGMLPSEYITELRNKDVKTF